LASAALAGPINPPAGPVTSTLKTLVEVEPRIAVNSVNTPASIASQFVITQPGSYYLTGNVSAVTGKNGIEIAAKNVTLDLNGFIVDGRSLAGTLHGIRFSAGVSVTNVTVLNGTISNWSGSGVEGRSSSNCRFERLLVESNDQRGIFAGTNCTVRVCTTANNGLAGIDVFFNSTVTDCVATSNSDGGIRASSGCTISGCTAVSNTFGIITGTGCTITHCTAHSNSGAGVTAGSGNLVSQCAATFNQGNGFVIATRSTVTAYSPGPRRIACTIF
jgi:parallel beta-helix repeat protein